MASSTYRTVVLDVGKKSKKAIKRMKRGEGPSIDDAERAANDTLASDGKGPAEAICVVFLYEKKKKKRGPPNLGLARLLPYPYN